MARTKSTVVSSKKRGSSARSSTGSSKGFAKRSQPLPTPKRTPSRTRTTPSRSKATPKNRANRASITPSSSRRVTKKAVTPSSGKKRVRVVSEKTPAKKRARTSSTTSTPRAGSSRQAGKGKGSGDTAAPSKAKAPVAPTGKASRLRQGSIKHTMSLLHTALPSVLERTATIRRPGVSEVLKEFMKAAEKALSQPIRGVGTRASSALSKVATSNKSLENGLLRDSHHVRVLESELKAAHERLDMAKERLRTFNANVARHRHRTAQTESSKLHKLLSTPSTNDTLQARTVGGDANDRIAGKDLGTEEYDPAQEEDLSNLKSSLVRTLVKVRENATTVQDVTAGLFQLQTYLSRVVSVATAPDDDGEEEEGNVGRGASDWSTRRAARKLAEQT